MIPAPGQARGPGCSSRTHVFPHVGRLVHDSIRLCPAVDGRGLSESEVKRSLGVKWSVVGGYFVRLFVCLFAWWWWLLLLLLLLLLLQVLLLLSSLLVLFRPSFLPSFLPSSLPPFLPSLARLYHVHTAVTILPLLIRQPPLLPPPPSFQRN